MIERDLHLVRDDRRALPRRPYLDRRRGRGDPPAPRRAGLRVTCDTAPPYFALNENEVGDYRTFAKLSPPLRSENDRRAIVERPGRRHDRRDRHRPRAAGPGQQARALRPGGARRHRPRDPAAVALELLPQGRDLAARPAAPPDHARRPSSSACRTAGSPRARPPTSCCSIPTAPGRIDVGEVPQQVEELAVRRPPGAGPRARAPSSTAAPVFDAVRRALPDRRIIGIGSGRYPAVAAALIVGYLLRLDPVRPAADAARRPRRHPHDRLRQYRRHQRAAHRQQGARAGHAAARRRQGRRRRAARRAISGRPRLRSDRRRRRRCSAICFPVWLSFKGGKGVATTLGVLLGARPGWSACRPASTWLSVAVDLPLLVARRRCSPLAAAPLPMPVPRRPAPAAIAFAASCAVLVWMPPSRQHPPAASRARSRRSAGKPKTGAEQTIGYAMTHVALMQRGPLTPSRAARLAPADPHAKVSGRSPSASCSTASAPPSAALEALPELARRAGGRGRCTLSTVAQAEARTGAPPRRAAAAPDLPWCEPDYPAPLAAIDDAPPVLIWRSATASSSGRGRAVAIVGARNASAERPAACRRPRRATSAKPGFVVVSGLGPRHRRRRPRRRARRAAPVAVLAGGVDVIYPPENAASARAASPTTALLLTEMPPGTEPLAAALPAPQPHHLRRSALGVVVVEADAALRLADHRPLRRSTRVARSSPCPARRSIRAPTGPTGLIRDGARSGRGR